MDIINDSEYKISDKTFSNASSALDYYLHVETNGDSEYTEQSDLFGTQELLDIVKTSCLDTEKRSSEQQKEIKALISSIYELFGVVRQHLLRQEVEVALDNSHNIIERIQNDKRDFDSRRHLRWSLPREHESRSKFRSQSAGFASPERYINRPLSSLTRRRSPSPDLRFYRTDERLSKLNSSSHSLHEELLVPSSKAATVSSSKWNHELGARRAPSWLSELEARSDHNIGGASKRFSSHQPYVSDSATTNEILNEASKFIAHPVPSFTSVNEEEQESRARPPSTSQSMEILKNMLFALQNVIPPLEDQLSIQSPSAMKDPNRTTEALPDSAFLFAKHSRLDSGDGSKSLHKAISHLDRLKALIDDDT